MYTQYAGALRRSPLFRDISDDNMYSMLSCIRPRIKRCERDNILAIEGDRMEGVHILLSGTVTIAKETAGGKRVILSVLRSGSMFGEMAAFTREGTWPATVLCTEDCEILLLPVHSIVGMCSHGCEGHRVMIVNMLRILAEKAIGLSRRVEYLSIKTIRGKIARLLMDLHEKTESNYVRVHMNRNEMADFLGVARPSLSRELSNMQNDGLIEYIGKEFKLKELEALTEIMYN